MLLLAKKNSHNVEKLLEKNSNNGVIFYIFTPLLVFNLPQILIISKSLTRRHQQIFVF